ncbi:hypothetical protein HBH70_136710 [Parastagonospora nodorum]|nr:hypothetical protein HBH92_172630 [Parastagonospora nodorum]KAH4447953.1 hypothetical protein HBH93_052370 [Parastagonospora nodorum]KAH4460222.1 hypothetical protein HBH91_071490 [Parastagonospora nodorum]KAH4497029.1 hypothetical protein HBH89_139660 [Parastagonospora nodorum]KAH4535313.1 hypothetical protein HBH85_163010 [Parastagonospora nodorum]
MTKPAILIVPGSFAPPSIYKDIVEHLRKAGFQAVALRTPSTLKRMPLPPATMSDDASAIKGAVEAVIAQGKEVVVVCHSYGGTPTTQALAGLKVKRIVYLTAIVPKLGQSNVEAMGGEKGVLPMEATEGYLHIDATMMAAAVCNDLSWDVGYEHCLNLAHHSAAAFLEEVTQVAYKDIPVSYIFCENDLVVTPKQQEGFINVIAEATGKGVDVVNLPYGHCPNWSAPEKVAEIFEQLAMK